MSYHPGKCQYVKGDYSLAVKTNYNSDDKMTVNDESTEVHMVNQSQVCTFNYFLKSQDVYIRFNLV